MPGLNGEWKVSRIFLGEWGISWKQNNRQRAMLILLLWEDLSFSCAFIRGRNACCCSLSLFHNGMEIIQKQCDLYLLVFKGAFNIRVFSEWFQDISHFLFFMCLLLSLKIIHKKLQTYKPQQTLKGWGIFVLGISCPTGNLEPQILFGISLNIFSILPN